MKILTLIFSSVFVMALLLPAAIETKIVENTSEFILVDGSSKLYRNELRLWDLKLSSHSAPIWCPISTRDSQICSKSGEKLKISAVAASSSKKRRIFRFYVTGGKIIGTGANVIWDLSEVGKEEYRITAWLENETRRGRSISKTVKREECPVCDLPCECPRAIGIETVKSKVKAGKTINFTAKVLGGDQSNIAYVWTVKNGRIVKGQGKRKVRIKADWDKEGESLEVSLSVGGLCEACPSEVKTKIPIEQK